VAERSHGENRRKRITIIAGPNGAGTTTFARESLPLEVGINADLMRAG
jgi:predicted ABC-type ATPase